MTKMGYYTHGHREEDIFRYTDIPSTHLILHLFINENCVVCRTGGRKGKSQFIYINNFIKDMYRYR